MLSQKKWLANILYRNSDVIDTDYKSYSKPLPNSLRCNRYPYKKTEGNNSE